MVDLNKPSSIERTIALTEIYATFYSYSVSARDSTDWETKSKAFAPNARIVLPGGQVLPVSNFKEIVRGREAKFYRHHITSIDVQFTAEDRALAVCQTLASTEKSSLDHWGEWRDTMVKGEDGRWLIEEMVAVVDGRDPDGWYAETYA